MGGINTIECHCGKVTDDFYGYPDDVLYCKECYIKSQLSYYKSNLSSANKRLEEKKERVSELENKIDLLERGFVVE